MGEAAGNEIIRRMDGSGSRSRSRSNLGPGCSYGCKPDGKREEKKMMAMMMMMMVVMI